MDMMSNLLHLLDPELATQVTTFTQYVQIKAAAFRHQSLLDSSNYIGPCRRKYKNKICSKAEHIETNTNSGKKKKKR